MPVDFAVVVIKIVKGAPGVFYQRLAKAFPMLKAKLKQAGMDDRPEDFI